MKKSLFLYLFISVISLTSCSDYQSLPLTSNSSEDKITSSDEQENTTSLNNFDLIYLKDKTKVISISLGYECYFDYSSARVFLEEYVELNYETLNLNIDDVNGGFYVEIYIDEEGNQVYDYQKYDSIYAFDTLYYDVLFYLLQ